MRHFGFRFAMRPSMLLALTLAAGNTAAAPAPKEEPVFYEAVDVSVVNIEVFVTDKSGKPVSGLSRDDFEVYENRKKVEITHFWSQTGEGDEGEGEDEDAAAESPKVERTLAAFFDNRNLETPARQRVVVRLEELVHRLAPKDRFVLINSGRQGMDMQSFRAGDREAISRALSAPVDCGGYETREITDRLRLELCTCTLAGQARRDAELYSDARLREVIQVFRELESSVDTLAGLPGHKALFFITGDLPLRPLETLLGNSMITGRDASKALDQVVARANASQVTIYGLGVPTKARITGGAEDHAKLASLPELAAGSGGQFALDPIDPGGLVAQVLRDLSTFYSLGYTSAAAKAGDLRRIKVKVRRPGLEVRFRESYRAKSGVEKALDRTATALFLGETRNPLGVAVEFGEIRPTDQGQLEVEITVSFPLDRVTLLPAEGVRKGQAHLFLASRDGRGNSSDVTRILIPLRIAEADLAKTLTRRAGYRARLLLRPEPGQVAVGLRDELGNSDSTLLVPWNPPATGDEMAKK